jgi:uncharacterized protein YjbJ (UPF0337 family)
MSNRHGRHEAAIYSDAGVGGTGRVCLRSQVAHRFACRGNWEERVDGYRQQAGEQGRGAEGKAKDTAGAVSGDEQLQAEGQSDQAKGNMKQAGEKVEDVFKS